MIQTKARPLLVNQSEATKRFWKRQTRQTRQEQQEASPILSQDSIDYSETTSRIKNIEGNAIQDNSQRATQAEGVQKRSQMRKWQNSPNKRNISKIKYYNHKRRFKTSCNYKLGDDQLGEITRSSSKVSMKTMQ